MGAGIHRVSEIQSLESVCFLLNKSALRASSNNVGGFRTCAATKSMLVDWYIHPLDQSIQRQIWVGRLVPVEGRRKHLLDLGPYRHRYSFQGTTKLAEYKCSVLWDGWFWHICWPPLNPVLVGRLEFRNSEKGTKECSMGRGREQKFLSPSTPSNGWCVWSLAWPPSSWGIVWPHRCYKTWTMMGVVLLSSLAQTSGCPVLNSCR